MDDFKNSLWFGILVGIVQRRSGKSSVLILSILAFIVCIGGAVIVGGVGVYTVLIWGYTGATYTLVLAAIVVARSTSRIFNSAHYKKGLGTALQPPQP